MSRSMLFLLALPLGSSPRRYYVDAGAGNDAGSGRSPAQAWRSLAKVNASAFQPGDQVLFKRGETWAEALVPPSDGAPGKPVLFAAYGSGALPVIDGGGARATCIDATGRNHLAFRTLKTYRPTSSGILFTSGLHTVTGCTLDASGDQNAQNVSTANVTYTACTFTGAADDGISVHGPATVTVNGCTFSGNNQAINTTLAGVTLAVNDCIFEGNIANDILPAEAHTYNRCLFKLAAATDNLKMFDGPGTLNYCIFDATAALTALGTRIAINSGGTLTLNNCVLYGGNGANSNGGVYCGATSTLVMNNCIVYKWQRCAYIEAGGAVNADHCCFNTIPVKNLTANTHEITADPLLVDPDNDDYRLQAGSPCRSAGADLGLEQDFDSVPVPQETFPAIGAFEYVG